MKDAVWNARRELDRQRDWADKNINRVQLHFNPHNNPTTWAEVKANTKPIKAAWEPH